MKRAHCVVLAACLGALLAPAISPVARAADRKTAPKLRPALPLAVRATLPNGARSLRVDRLPLGPNGAIMLAHTWVSARKSEPGANAQWRPSPICVDVFEPVPNTQPAQWRFVASGAYMGVNAPTEVSARWLYPKKKLGPVIVFVTPVYIATVYDVMVFPNGFSERAGDNDAVVQEFAQGGVGGGKILQNFGVDARGTMTVISESWLYGKKQSQEVRAWNGFGFGPLKTR